ncbi:MAG: DUF1801 domain-containing protein [Saprospiraceae bacterium]
MQSVAFRNIGEMLDYLPEDQLAIVEKLRELVFECIPGVEERLSFNVPFYRKYAGICFIWPGAVAWGSKTWAGVEFGFQHGNLLADELRYLERGTRKQVFSKRFFRLEDINEGLLRAYLFEAVEVDELKYVETNRRAKARRQ